MELKPGQQPRTTVIIFETPVELSRANEFSNLSVRVLGYFGLAKTGVDTKPLTGAVVGEDGLILPSETRIPVSNKRIIRVASRLVTRSFSDHYDPQAAKEDRAIANSITDYLDSFESVDQFIQGEPSLESESPSFIGRG